MKTLKEVVTMETWANKLFTILKERFDWEDRQATQSLEQEFRNIVLLPGENRT